jgi:DGQHR domain-containing protein
MQTISVIVPQNPFVPKELENKKVCLCALDVVKLMEWWPGTPHVPHRNPEKVKAIQRSLDWNRVAQIAAYLLQREIDDVPDRLKKYFNEIYEPNKYEPGREWPPTKPKVISYKKSAYPVFSNILVHVNGATLNVEERKVEVKNNEKTEKQKVIENHIGKTGQLSFNENEPTFSLSVIDGQHRINGAYFALKIKQEEDPNAYWELPAEVFIDLDPPDRTRIQAQIFIDVNYYQKKVDGSLVADLFPTARGLRDANDDKERAQDIGRRLMLEVGPLVGMIQIPGIRYGVKDVVTLATLNSAIEDTIPSLNQSDITDLEAQTRFIGQLFECWLKASGRMEEKGTTVLDHQSVVYQGRVLVSIITLTPAILLHLKSKKLTFFSDKARQEITNWLEEVVYKANLTKDDIFISKDEFRKLGFLGSGGIGKLRDRLWAAAIKKTKLSRISEKKISELANEARKKVYKVIGELDD